MELLISHVLIFSSVGLLVYQLCAARLIGEVRLPADIKGHSVAKPFAFKSACIVYRSLN
jgi:hypothetical protein